jgi:hypothetical protein
MARGARGQPPPPAWSQQDVTDLKFRTLGLLSQNTVRTVLQISREQLADLIHVGSRWIEGEYDQNNRNAVKMMEHGKQNNAIRWAKDNFTTYIQAGVVWRDKFNTTNLLFTPSHIQACIDYVFHKAKENLLKDPKYAKYHHKEKRATSVSPPRSELFVNSERNSSAGTLAIRQTLHQLNNTSIIIRSADLSFKYAVVPFTSLVSSVDSPIDAYHVRWEKLITKATNKVPANARIYYAYQTGEIITNNDESQSCILTYMKGFCQDKAGWLLLCVAE